MANIVSIIRCASGSAKANPPRIPCVDAAQVARPGRSQRQSIRRNPASVIVPPRHKPSEKWTVMTSPAVVEKKKPAVAPGVLNRTHDGNAEYHAGPDRCWINCRALCGGHRATGLPGRSRVSTWVGADRRRRRGSVRKPQLSTGWKICSPAGENRNGSAPDAVRGAGKPSLKGPLLGKRRPLCSSA